jgi:hypothetical protein
MSEFLKAVDSWDYTKNITGLEVNTGFITGLENILMFYVVNIVEDPATLAETFKKFELIITNQQPKENPIELSDIERQMYVLFSLLQLFKAHAYEQKLNIKLDSNVTKEQLSEYLNEVVSGDKDKAKEKLEKIMSLIKPSSEVHP